MANAPSGASGLAGLYFSLKVVALTLGVLEIAYLGTLRGFLKMQQVNLFET